MHTGRKPDLPEFHPSKPKYTFDKDTKKPDRYKAGLHAARQNPPTKKRRHDTKDSKKNAGTEEIIRHSPEMPPRVRSNALTANVSQIITFYTQIRL